MNLNFEKIQNTQSLEMDSSSATPTLPIPIAIGITAGPALGESITAYSLHMHHKRGSIPPP